MSTHQLATDAAWIADAWPALNESRLKGTPRRWHETELTAQQRAQREAQPQNRTSSHTHQPANIPSTTRQSTRRIPT